MKLHSAAELITNSSDEVYTDHEGIIKKINETLSTITCPYCDGEGYVHYNPEKFGNEMFECDECGGAGEITEKEYFMWLIDHVERHTKRRITIVLEDGQIVK